MPASISLACALQSDVRRNKWAVEVQRSLSLIFPSGLSRRNRKTMIQMERTEFLLKQAHGCLRAGATACCWHLPQALNVLFDLQKLLGVYSRLGSPNFKWAPVVHILMGNTSFGRQHVKSPRLFCSLGLGYETRGLTCAQRALSH